MGIALGVQGGVVVPEACALCNFLLRVLVVFHFRKYSVVHILPSRFFLLLLKEQ